MLPSRIVRERVIAAYALYSVSYRRLLSNDASNLHPFVNNICLDGYLPCEGNEEYRDDGIDNISNIAIRRF